MSSSLQRLPSELQQQIVSHVAATKCITSIHSLLLTCRCFYNVALPFSVQTYCNKPRPRRPQGPQPRSRTLQFLRYIVLVKPELARHVQNLHVQDWQTEDEEQHKPSAIEADEWPLYKRLIRKVFPSEEEVDSVPRSLWEPALHEGVEDASIALLLVVCSNIQSLTYPEPNQPSIFSSVLSAIIEDTRIRGAAPVFLNRLQSVKHLPGEEGYLNFRFEELLAWSFLMPHIQAYEGVKVILHSYTSGIAGGIPRRSSSIKSLTLREAICTSSAFLSMIGACQSLQTLHYTNLSAGASYERYARVTPRDIVEALLPHADTLEDLYVASEEGLGPWTRYSDIPNPGWTYMGVQLRQMHKLKHLTLGVEALNGIINLEEEFPPDIFKKPAAPPFAECFPEQVEHLEIRGCTRDDLAQLTELVTTLRNEDRFSKLQSARFTFTSTRLEEVELENLRLERSGLTVEVIHD